MGMVVQGYEHVQDNANLTKDHSSNKMKLPYLIPYKRMTLGVLA